VNRAEVEYAIRFYLDLVSKDVDRLVPSLHAAALRSNIASVLLPVGFAQLSFGVSKI